MSLCLPVAAGGYHLCERGAAHCPAEEMDHSQADGALPRRVHAGQLTRAIFVTVGGLL
jgi:hypothetical protein